MPEFLHSESTWKQEQVSRGSVMSLKQEFQEGTMPGVTEIKEGVNWEEGVQEANLSRLEGQRNICSVRCAVEQYVMRIIPYPLADFVGT